MKVLLITLDAQVYGPAALDDDEAALEEVLDVLRECKDTAQSAFAHLVFDRLGADYEVTERG